MWIVGRLQHRVGRRRAHHRSFSPCGTSHPATALPASAVAGFGVARHRDSHSRVAFVPLPRSTPFLAEALRRKHKGNAPHARLLSMHLRGGLSSHLECAERVECLACLTCLASEVNGQLADCCLGAWSLLLHLLHLALRAELKGDSLHSVQSENNKSKDKKKVAKFAKFTKSSGPLTPHSIWLACPQLETARSAWWRNGSTRHVGRLVGGFTADLRAPSGRQSPPVGPVRPCTGP